MYRSKLPYEENFEERRSRNGGNKERAIGRSENDEKHANGDASSYAKNVECKCCRDDSSDEDYISSSVKELEDVKPRRSARRRRKIASLYAMRHAFESRRKKERSVKKKWCNRNKGPTARRNSLRFYGVDASRCDPSRETSRRNGRSVNRFSPKCIKQDFAKPNRFGDDGATSKRYEELFISSLGAFRERPDVARSKQVSTSLEVMNDDDDCSCDGAATSRKNESNESEPRKGRTTNSIYVNPRFRFLKTPHDSPYLNSTENRWRSSRLTGGCGYEESTSIYCPDCECCDSCDDVLEVLQVCECDEPPSQNSRANASWPKNAKLQRSDKRDINVAANLTKMSPTPRRRDASKRDTCVPRKSSLKRDESSAAARKEVRYEVHERAGEKSKVMDILRKNHDEATCYLCGIAASRSVSPRQKLCAAVSTSTRKKLLDCCCENEMKEEETDCCGCCGCPENVKINCRRYEPKERSTLRDKYRGRSSFLHSTALPLYTFVDDVKSSTRYGEEKARIRGDDGKQKKKKKKKTTTTTTTTMTSTTTKKNHGSEVKRTTFNVADNLPDVSLRDHRGNCNTRRWSEVTEKYRELTDELKRIQRTPRLLDKSTCCRPKTTRRNSVSCQPICVPPTESPKRAKCCDNPSGVVRKNDQTDAEPREYIRNSVNRTTSTTIRFESPSRSIKQTSGRQQQITVRSVQTDSKRSNSLNRADDFSRRSTRETKDECEQCCGAKEYRCDTDTSVEELWQSRRKSSNNRWLGNPSDLRIVKPKSSDGKTNVEKMLIYPPRGVDGPPLILYKNSSNINCQVKGDTNCGFRYDVTYVQKFVSPLWCPRDEQRQERCPINDDKECLCSSDYG